MAELNLRCAEDLPGTDSKRLAACLAKVDDWSVLVDQYTRYSYPSFRKNPHRFRGSEARFRAMALAECLQRYVGIRYNFAFAEGEYDASDSRNLFIHGILTGFGGTCASMPVLYNAIGRRLGYPVTMGEAKEHYFCRWDDDSDEHFCFDATSRGCTPRDEDYYRRWPKQMTPVQEQMDGHIRPMTRREELAVFADARANCLFDNFQFVPAMEAYDLAHQIVPHKRTLNHSWGLAIYSVKLVAELTSLPDELKDAPIEQTIGQAADKLCGPEVDLFRRHAVQNVLRIVRNRRVRRRMATHPAAI